MKLWLTYSVIVAALLCLALAGPGVARGVFLSIALFFTAGTLICIVVRR